MVLNPYGLAELLDGDLTPLGIIFPFCDDFW